MSKQNIEELGKNVGLPQKHTKQVVEFLKHDILISLYRSEKDIAVIKAKDEDQRTEHEKFSLILNERIEKKYQETYKKKFDPKVHAKNKKLPLFLMGPPGQGKTAAYLAAGEAVAKWLNLEFISHVTDDYEPKPNHFIMVVQECAGENSAITFGGVPKASVVKLPDGKEQDVLKKALTYRFTVFQHVAGGVLLFDDAANAASVIQNVLLPVAQNNTFQGLKIPHALVGFTGNLGALDGTYTAEQSSALLTRVIPMFVTDTVKDFLDRGYRYYNDELGDVGYFSFLSRNEKDFAALPENGQKSGFACSRSHDNFIQGMRSIVERNGGRGVGEAESLHEIRDLARSCFGSEYANKVVSYYNSYIQGADPLARAFIVEGKHDLNKLAEKYNGGTSSEGITFGYQFATACGDYAVNEIASIRQKNGDKITLDNKDFVKIVKRFGEALLALNASEFAYSIEHLKNKLAIYIEDFAQKAKESVELNSDSREAIATIIADLDGCSQDKRSSLIAVITDYDKMKASSSLGSKRSSSRAKMS